mmetsp:Transcript_21976/g.32097  ORF Transcript_21976/g.32097 Transcript_21976/m.32097 type:complete len:183 (+) Transcript_21976:82-630(+)|eukprot:CAMPEP_0197240458 /NCGR_PEP_ID=MMETSP1429-20130617/6741_1 /TAXON_ID=49237 /ORGANISM="Chaetoceros  sp., Strain UNC1202" /LENGTH=182 /DNA_ID=CAMNT_0042700103 /DNA_START=17 /DNA_END=565 /DNA_ORIENTATION=+
MTATLPIQSESVIIVGESTDTSTNLTKMPQQCLPDLVSEESSDACDACPYCTDICRDSDCEACAEKMELMMQKNKKRDEDQSRPFDFVTPCELRRHNTRESAWLLCGDVIYDATKIIKGHPGGSRSILRKSGGVCDCTKDMSFHSSGAVKQMKKNRVGVLRPCPGETGIDATEEHMEGCVIC